MSRKCCLYIAISLDGFIARKNEDVGWLPTDGGPIDKDFGYAKFYKSVGAVILGRKTYEQIFTFGIDYPYANVPNFILTRRKNVRRVPRATFYKGDVAKLVRSIKVPKGKKIYLVGGGDVIAQFMNKRLVDEIDIAVIPILIGNGIPLFSGV